MPQDNQILVLGSGTSTGVPMVGCYCKVCTSPSSYNKRLRASILMQTATDRSILVDTTPDLRTQLLSHQIDSIDQVIITHEHADHLHGIDDLRPLCFKKPPKRIPIHAPPQLSDIMHNRFPYIFTPEKVFKDANPIYGGGIPLLDLFTMPSIQLDAGISTYEVAGEEISIFGLPHGQFINLGFVHQSFAYLIDCHEIPQNILLVANRPDLSRPM